MDYFKPALIFTLLLAAIIVYAEQAHESSQGKPDPIVIDLQKTATLSSLVENLAQERVVYVGETHTAYEDHLLQLEILKGMQAQQGNFAIGVEWFQWPFQEHLDAYLAGEITEAGMLDKTGYYERWRFDYRLYRPILAYAREQGIPVIALNAPAELTSAISSADIPALSGELQEMLPDSYDFSDTDYRRRLEAFYNEHPDSGGSFEGFLQVQLTWDESMAQKVSEYLKADPANRMLVLAGSGHVEYRSGIPARVTRRTGVRGKTVLMPKFPVSDERVADYLLLAEPVVLPEAGVFGAFLDTAGEGVVISDFTESSTGRQAGMQPQDRILAIDGIAIGNYADLKLAMLDKHPGDGITVELERPAESGEGERISLQVELGSREMPKNPHGP
ncbi:MAG: ChaN family lipoprotein [Chromatiales bacterium]|jgi:uncharacterized iron-regulated protein